jgi:hypothetical protein
LEDRPVSDGKVSLVARAFEPVVLLRVINGTRKMSAFLAIADMLALSYPHKDAMVIFGRICEELHSSDRNFAESSYHLLWIGGCFPEHRAHQNPEITDEHAEASEHEELRQLSAGNIAFVGRAN